MTNQHSRNAYFAIFLVTGTTFGVVGPSLPLLAEQVGSTVADVGTVLIFYGGGYLAGTRLFVRGYDRGWGNRLIGSAGLVAALCFAAVSLGPTLTALCAACAASQRSREVWFQMICVFTVALKRSHVCDRARYNQLQSS